MELKKLGMAIGGGLYTALTLMSGFIIANI